MRKLLSANFYAMFRSKRFWLGLFMMAATAVYMVVDIYKMKRLAAELDSGVFQGAILLFILLPALGALFINTDYHDGTIRNKLTVGHTRARIYLSNLITNCTVGVIYITAYEIIYLLVGFPFLGSLSQPQAFLIKLGMLLLVLLSLTAIFTLLATLITNRSVLLYCALLGMGLVLAAQMVNASLAGPEMVDDYGGVSFTTNEDGTVTTQYLDKDGTPIKPEDIPRVPNPRYVKEPMRSFLRTVNNIQPGGQLVEILEDGHEEPDGSKPQTPYWQLAAYALATSLVFTGAGILLFRRKDLK
ncbi:ABC transporter permease subunit [Oscillospiraceae bacterium 42-9]